MGIWNEQNVDTGTDVPRVCFYYKIGGKSMGKRELFIVLAFIVAGTAVYEVTAKPAPAGEGFSFSKFWSSAQHGFQTTVAQADWTTSQQVAVSAATRTIRIKGVNGRVQVIGEVRADIGIEMVVTASGPDQTAALAAAKRGQIVVETFEDAIIVSSKLPPAPIPGRQMGRAPLMNITLKVPRQLAANIDGATGVTASNLAGLRITNSTGSSTVSKIAGTLDGDFRASAIELTDIGKLDLTLTGADAKIADVHGGIRLEVRNGSCALSGNTTGAVDIDARQAAVTVTGNTSVVAINGTGGRVDLVNPKSEVRVDMRRTRITATLGAAVPLSLSTSDDQIALAMSGDKPPAITIDATAESGDVLATDFGLTAAKIDQDSHLQYGFGGDARVSLHTVNGNIVFTHAPAVEIKH